MPSLFSRATLSRPFAMRKRPCRVLAENASVRLLSCRRCSPTLCALRNSAIFPKKWRYVTLPIVVDFADSPLTWGYENRLREVRCMTSLRRYKAAFIWKNQKLAGSSGWHSDEHRHLACRCRNSDRRFHSLEHKRRGLERRLRRRDVSNAARPADAAVWSSNAAGRSASNVAWHAGVAERSASAAT